MPTKKQTIEPTVCGLCGFSSKRITAVERHIEAEHGVSAKEAFDRANGATTCRCGCGKETKWINYKVGYSSMIKGHNASIYSVYDNQKAAEIAQTRGSNWRGQASWSKGLTKETDERVAARAKATSEGRKKAFADDEIVAWSKGLTKETDERVAAAAAALKDAYQQGRYTPWSKGLTKKTDERVASMAEAVSVAHKTAAVRTRLDELKRLNIEEIRKRIEGGGNLRLLSAEGYVNDATTNIYVECISCKTRTYSSLRQLQHHRCYSCDPAGSAAQGEIAAYVESLGVEVVRNTRKMIAGPERGAELDVFIPSRSVAVEYNGLYWHCSIHKSDVYHQNKSAACKAAGIKLFHVFQDEWAERRPLVEAMIRHMLGMSSRVGARTCEVVDVPAEERRLFFDENHLDGDTKASHAIGLKHDGELVMVMSLRHPFHKTHSKLMEIARLATKRDLVVPGGLSRLSKAALAWTANQGQQGMITYVDTRLGGPASWVASGWTVVGETTPRFWWTDFHSRFNRFRYRADSSRGMTEAEVAAEAKVVKIFGCNNVTLKMLQPNK